MLDYEIREIPRPLNTTQIEDKEFLGMISTGCHGRNSYGDRVEFSDNHGPTASTEGVIHDLAKRGVLGTGTTQKRGVLGTGKTKKGGLRHGHESKNGS